MKTQQTVPTFDSVWAILQETAQLQKENEREAKESFKELRKTIQEVAQLQKKNERERKENDREYRQRMKKLDKRIGSIGNNNGNIAEQYFINSFDEGETNFFGEKFDDMAPRVKGLKKGFRDEYDILLINGKSIGIVEIKYKAHENDIPKVIKKAETFRVNFPEYQHHKVYLGLASLAFYPELEEACLKNGIAIVKQVGDTVIISDEHLKVY